MAPGSTRPPESLTISSAHRSAAMRAACSSAPRSNRCEASVWSPCRRAVRRMPGGSKTALSSRIRVVRSDTSLVAPPITPASATGRSASAMTRSSALSLRSLPSRVVIGSPSPARRTTMREPFSFSRSKAWSGCPSSSRTRLIASTTLLMGRTPQMRSLSCSRSGEGPIFTPSMTRATYRGQRSGSSRSTRATASTARSPESPSEDGGRRAVAPVSADSSRAMPKCESASGRFGVTLISSTKSGSPSSWAMGAPGDVSRGRRSRPLWSSDKPSSRAEQSMPALSMPRSLARSMRIPAGSVAPGVAIGTTSPTWKFCAPQTTWCVPRPSSTRVMERWSDPGTFSAAAMRAATIPGSRVSPSIASTSKPASVRRRAISGAGRSVGHSSRSQLTEILMDLSLELLQDPHVVLEEGAQVFDAVPEHGEPIDADAEGVARVLLRIDAHALQLVGIHHPRAEHLEPAGELADLAPFPATERVRDVHLGSGLDEGEVARPQAGADVGAEERLHEGIERPAQVRHGEAFLDVQAFHLVEHRRVRDVGIAAGHLPRRDDAHPRLLRLPHGANLAPG